MEKHIGRLKLKDKKMSEADYDISIIRPRLNSNDFKLRAKGIAPERRKAIKKALLTLHTLELMATTVYRFQITRADTELNRQLIAAMCNEMTHYQDFQVKLYEYGFKPNPFRWAYWIVGFVFGFGSKIIGEKMMLKTGIWVENKAVNHYADLLETIEWDADTRKIVEKNQADEKGHVHNWKCFLNSSEYEKTDM